LPPAANAASKLALELSRRRHLPQRLFPHDGLVVVLAVVVAAAIDAAAIVAAAIDAAAGAPVVSDTLTLTATLSSRVGGTSRRALRRVEATRWDVGRVVGERKA
jgi:pyruvate carboxylase